jgi:hypothetical protein
MLAKNEAAAASSVGTCAERERLLDLLRGAIEELGAAVRDARETESARTRCEKMWVDLRQHRTEHRCARQMSG